MMEISLVKGAPGTNQRQYRGMANFIALTPVKGQRY